MKRLDLVEKATLRRDLPPFRVGDAVRVHVRVREGDKERIQVFEGLVIRRRGSGVSETFTVRKVASGVGVERIFPVQSPVVTKVEIRNRGHVRRARLYYLRELSGKKARLRSKVRNLSELLSPEEFDARDSIGDGAELAEELTADASAGDVAQEQEPQLRGKARKKAKALEKTNRMKVLKAEEEERESARAEEAAKQESKETAAEEPTREETPAAEESTSEETPAAQEPTTKETPTADTEPTSEKPSED